MNKKRLARQVVKYKPAEEKDGTGFKRRRRNLEDLKEDSSCKENFFENQIVKLKILK